MAVGSGVDVAVGALVGVSDGATRAVGLAVRLEETASAGAAQPILGRRGGAFPAQPARNSDSRITNTKRTFQRNVGLTIFIGVLAP